MIRGFQHFLSHEFSSKPVVVGFPHELGAVVGAPPQNVVLSIFYADGDDHEPGGFFEVMIGDPRIKDLLVDPSAMPLMLQALDTVAKISATKDAQQQRLLAEKAFEGLKAEDNEKMRELLKRMTAMAADATLEKSYLSVVMLPAGRETRWQIAGRRLTLSEAINQFYGRKVLEQSTCETGEEDTEEAPQAPGADKPS